MKYSCALHVEHEEPKNEHGEDAYTVFKLIQPINLYLNFEPNISIQTLAVLWNDRIDTRIIAMIEKGLIQGLLSPVILLREAEGTLHILYNGLLNYCTQSRFENAWREIARDAWEDEWTADFILDSQTYSAQAGDSAFRSCVNEIVCCHGLGLREFRGDRLHHHNRWQPDRLKEPERLDKSCTQVKPPVDFNALTTNCRSRIHAAFAPTQSCHLP
ncbi:MULTISPECIES: hypothetical protein [Pseudomonas chlororaphis group]|uniref:hypothetical protein n=1 Tax=Pseudomonas chlororaphis group TaxID=136842 RepID=UPI002097F74B|nr:MULTISPECIES: hypothetical protein [Pseudomonas chlororaphis group]MCO7580244.1 hypothetical protein [Pseudomonas protegens]MCO7586289.1 hypothetical protein [Pseudomonas chlororaphis]MCO7603401.1 hypothetical protein [Pseudomonas chlororaphis]